VGPLDGLKIVEFAAAGPAPMCAMLLADLGATVLRIDRAVAVELGTKRPLKFDLVQRGRHVITLDLKEKEGVALALEVISEADALIEGFRPGVMERLGLGPDICMARNPRLVYGRMTGWGQDGPLARTAAHDLNYIAITGALHSIGRVDQPPSIPLNLLGDYAGGSLYLAFGILAAIHETSHSSKGQVVDAAIVDGVMSLMTGLYGSLAAGLWQLKRGTNVMDSGAPFYNVYECADGKWISVAPVEKRFFNELLGCIGIDLMEIPDRMDRSGWANAHKLLAAKFRTRTREEWCDVFEGTDACFAPVLSMSEVSQHPQIVARKVMIDIDGVSQPAPAPRFGRTVPSMPAAPRSATRAEAMASLQLWFGVARLGELAKAGTLDAVMASVAKD